jgi:transposase
MAARVELREISNDEGNRLLRMIRRSSGSIVAWRRAQMVLLAAQRMPAARIAEVVFSDPDTVREVIHNFNRDGFDSLYPRYRGGRPRVFTLPQRQAIKRVALAVPTDLGQPFATWSLAKLADYLVAEEVVDDISHEGLRLLLHEEGVSFQAVRSWKRSNDPDFEAKKNRILEFHLGAVRDRGRTRRAGPRRPRRGHLPGRVRAAQPAAAAGRQGLGAACEAAPDSRHLHTTARRPPPAVRARHRLGSARRRGQRAKDVWNSPAYA